MSAQSISAHSALAIERVALDSLHLDPANARAHGDRNLDSIADSLKRFGQTEPLIVQGSSGRVIGGNGRLSVMRKLGWFECDVIRLEISDLEATALGIALNRTAELAEWDDGTLGRLLGELREEGALDGVGFDSSEIDELLAELDVDAQEVEDPGPGEVRATPSSKKGDLWLLGEHRILCGDSTRTEDVERLMAGQRASLLATDPPYLVDYKGAAGRSEVARGGRGASAASEGAGGSAASAVSVGGGDSGSPGYCAPGASGRSHWDDYLGDEEGLAFFRAYLEAALPHCIERVPVYQWHAHRRQALVERAWVEVGLLVHQQIIWAKPRGTLGRSFYMWAHEPCFVGWPQGKMPEKARRPEFSATTVWEIDAQAEPSEDHPTQKPLEIFTRAIEAHTLPGEVVLEPFSGSGSQIVAAESLGRRCFAMEQDPRYVDVAIKRWEAATGRTATLEGDGREFAEVAAERGAQAAEEAAREQGAGELAARVREQGSTDVAAGDCDAQLPPDPESSP